MIDKTQYGKEYWADYKVTRHDRDMHLQVYIKRSDKDLIAYINTKENKNKYLQELILKDYKEHLEGLLGSLEKK